MLQDTTVLMMDLFGKEAQILNQSGDRIEEYIHVGKNALQELYEQRTMLKVFFIPSQTIRVPKDAYWMLQTRLDFLRL